ncbi:MAG: hypothetical protein OXJ53_11755 [Gammaproteobacteria bacterium]|nr:hypothetical protein [Gammaproteobacteria bacterium]MDE0271555.1 hypothetical protein [Gammaproteobacteria bacterium]
MVDREIVKKNRWQVVIMAVALPILALFGVYSLIYLAGQDTLLQTTNVGEFVDPPLMARDLGLSDAEGRAVDGSDAWWVWVAAEDCAAACQQSLVALGRLSERLAENADRVRLAVVVFGPADSFESGAALDSMATEQFRSTSEQRLADGVYIVDPPGNVVLRYPLEADVDVVAEDLIRMLKVTRSG